MKGLEAVPAGNDRILRLAEWLADPSGWFAGDDGLHPEQRAMLADSPLLRAALNAHLTRRIGTRDVALDAGFLAALAQDDDLARASALATAPEDSVHRASQFLGAALCQDRLRMAVLRADRDSLAASLGPEALGFGLRRAPLLARALQSLPLAGHNDPLVAGRCLYASLIDHASTALHGLFRLRQSDPADPVPLTDVQAEAGWTVLRAAS